MKFHNHRFNKTRQANFGISQNVNLRKMIQAPASPDTIKCRILYDRHIQTIEYHPYQLKEIRSLKLIQDDFISYQYKLADRKDLDKLYAQKGLADDILIVKNGLITDTYYGNIAMLQRGKWYTPEAPLLEGTMRNFLLTNKKIIPRNIAENTVHDYQKICVFNAMIPFGKIIVSSDALH